MRRNYARRTQMKRSNANKRKNYFIRKGFQKNFIIKFCSLIIVGSILSGMLIFMMSRSTVTTTFKNSRLGIKSTADYILPAVLLSSFVNIFLISFAAIAITLFTSHRIVGPLYRIEKDIDEMASGNLSKKFSLRKSDEIKSLADSLNNMIQSLRNDMKDIKHVFSEIEDEIKKEGPKTSQKAKNNLAKASRLLAKFIT